MQQSLAKCKYFNPKKHRECNIHVYKEGFEFCVHHLNDLAQVDCPVDPSHQVLSHKLSKHIKLCNKTKLDQQLKSNPFFSEGINRPQSHAVKATKRLQDLFSQRSPLFQKLAEEMQLYFRRAVVVYCEQQQLPLEQTISYLLDREVPQGTEHSDNEKDLLQVQLLVKAIKDFGLLQHKNCFIEYGAGKGRLSHGIAEQLAVEDKEKKSCHVLIEREPRRLKFDRFHRENPYFMRLRMDITDFNLATLQGQLPESYFQEYNSILEYVGVCKHMCGAGTDLTVASLLSSRGQGRTFTGLVCATCCHHLCDDQLYGNMAFLRSIGIDEELIPLVFACSSWYVSGAIADAPKPQLLEQTEGDFFDRFTSEMRSLVGKMAKRIIDIGRILHIMSQAPDMEGQLLKYCESSLSPENFVILLRRR